MAHPPRPTVRVGVIEAIEAESHRISIRLSESHSLLVLAWVSDTDFIQNGVPVHADALKIGTRVKVAYRHPFFGPMFASSVSWKRP